MYWSVGFKGKRRASRLRKWQTLVCKGRCEARPEKREKEQKDAVCLKLLLLLKRSTGNLLWYNLRKAEG